MNSFIHFLLFMILLFFLLMLVDGFLKKYFAFPYAKFLHSTGVTVKWFRFSWYTQFFNRTFTRIGTWRPRLIRTWFACGAVLSSILVLPGMILLISALIHAFVPEDAAANNFTDTRVKIQPVVPGITFPLSDLGYYFFTLLICSVIHEAGHAISAVSDDVTVLGFGFFFMIMIPAAYVELPTDQVLDLRPFQQLKVFAAGIWHNIILTLLAYFIVFSLPIILSPVYKTGTGLTITSVQQDSAVIGPSGIEVGDEITAINDCQIRSEADWTKCLRHVMISPTISLCLKNEDLMRLDSKFPRQFNPEDPPNCCDEMELKSSLCYLEIGSNDAGVTSRSPDLRNRNNTACLPVRQALEMSGSACDAASCPGPYDHCLQPILTNNSKLLKVVRSGKKDFLFVGNPVEVFQAVSVTHFRPKFGLVPLGLPKIITTLANYIATFSAAFAILNVVPCFFLDGQHMIRVLVTILFSCHDKKFRNIIIWTFNILGTLLLVLNLIVGMWQAI